jgi:hypothetical protein
LGALSTTYEPEGGDDRQDSGPRVGPGQPASLESNQKRIVADLNRRGVPSPSAGRRGTGSWAPTAVREILRRERYNGWYVHGVKDRVKKGGKRIARMAEPTQVLRIELPEWRIVDSEAWEAVQSARPKHAARTRALGRRSKHALAGIARCGHCGGGIVVRNTKTALGRVKGYTCGFHHQRGEAVCPVTVCQPVQEVDGALLDWVRGILTETLVVDIVGSVRAELEHETAVPTDMAALEAELARLRTEQQRLAAAIAKVPDADALLGELQKRVASIKRLEAELAAAERGPALQRQMLAKVEAMARRKLAALQEALGRDPEGTREVFADVFGPGDLLFSPVEWPNPGRKPRRLWRIEGSARFNLECDPTGNHAKVDLEIPVSVMTVRAA